MSDPAVEAAQRAAKAMLPQDVYATRLGDAEKGAREALKPIRELYAQLKSRYGEIEDRMLATGNTAAETSRHANEMAGLKLALDALAPLIFSTEELTQ